MKIKYYLEDNYLYKNTEDGVFSYDDIMGWRPSNASPKLLASLEISEEEAFLYIMEHPVIDFNFRARIPKILIPMLRRTFPELITSEIVGVQPMTQPTSLPYQESK